MPATRSSTSQSQQAPGPSRRRSPRTKQSSRRPTSKQQRSKITSQYVKDLEALPSTKQGLELQSRVIDERLEKIARDQQLRNDLFIEAPLFTLLQKVNELKASRPYGKVGMHISKDTLGKLEDSLAMMDDIDDVVEEEEDLLDDAIDDQIDIPESVEFQDEKHLAENIQETFEGLDRDLLGVNSQAALDKISAFVTKAIVDNHPSKTHPQATQTSSTRATTSTSSIPVIPSSISAAKSSTRKEPPFKFAFLSVVATYDAKCAVSLQELQAKVRTVTFDPTWFHSAVLTLPRSECRVAIFENGKFVITGVTTIKMALIAARNVLEIFKLCGFTPEISKRNFRAKNLTAMMELGVNIDIMSFAEKHQQNTYIDQDTFGAVTHFPEKSPSTIHKGGLGLCMLIFATGKIILVGGKTEKHMISVFREKTLGLLKPFAYGWI